MMRDAWSMSHTTRRTNVDSYSEREFQAGKIIGSLSNVDDVAEDHA